MLPKLTRLNEQAVSRHLEKVFEDCGRVDISFNAIGIPQQGIQGTPLAELSAEKFFLPAETYIKSHFFTAKAAAKFMTRGKNGVILFHTPQPARLATPLVGECQSPGHLWKLCQEIFRRNWQLRALER